MFNYLIIDCLMLMKVYLIPEYSEVGAKTEVAIK